MFVLKTEESNSKLRSLRMKISKLKLQIIDYKRENKFEQRLENQLLPHGYLVALLMTEGKLLQNDNSCSSAQNGLQKN